MSQSRPLPEHGHFISSGVQLHHLRGTRKAILMVEVIYIDAHNRRHVARPGLMVDGRSGRGLYYLIGTPFDSRHLEATVIHDLYCALAEMATGSARKELRRLADSLFGETLHAVGESKWKCMSMPWAVRKQARVHQGDPAVDWRDNFASEESAAANAENPFVM